MIPGDRCNRLEYLPAVFRPQGVGQFVENQDPTPEEFESTDMHREKVVVGGSRIAVYIGPLPAGTYTFFGDFHPQLARGHIVVK